MKRKMIASVMTGMMVTTLLTGCGKSTGSSAGGETTGGGETQATTATGSQNDEAVMYTTDVDDSYVLPEINVESKDITSLGPFDVKSDGKNAFWEIYEMFFEVEGFGGKMFPMPADGSKGEFGSYSREAGTSDYTVYIHDNIYDSAGNHVTTSDVVFNYDKIFTTGQTSGWSVYFEGCVEVVDDYTVTFHFTNGLNKMEEIENIRARYSIVSGKAYNDSSSRFISDACSSGPYKLTEFTVSAACTIEARDDYWQIDKGWLTQYQRANVSKINYKVITESTQFVVGLETDEIDCVEDSMIADLIGDFQDGGSYSDKYSIYQYKNNLTIYMMADCSDDSICRDVNMRNAIMHAVDTKGLQVVLDGEKVAARTNYLGSDVFSDYNPEWDTWDNYQTTSADVDTIQRYLDVAGYNGETITILAVQQFQNYCQTVQSMLPNYGVKNEITLYDYSTYVTTKANPASWDLVINQMTASDYLVNVWSHAMDVNNTGTGLTDDYVSDSEWQETLDKCKVSEAHTTGNMNAWWQHCVGNAYLMDLAVEYVNVVYPENMTSILMTGKNHVVFGGCTYKEK